MLELYMLHEQLLCGCVLGCQPASFQRCRTASLGAVVGLVDCICILIVCGACCMPLQRSRSLLLTLVCTARVYMAVLVASNLQANGEGLAAAGEGKRHARAAGIWHHIS
jgi:hypothetical protein